MNSKNYLKKSRYQKLKYILTKDYYINLNLFYIIIL